MFAQLTITAAFGIPTLGFDPTATITAELRNSSGAGSSSVYEPHLLKNGASQFRDSERVRRRPDAWHS